MSTPSGRCLATLATIVMTLGLSACFTSTADFRRDAETFIVENQELSTALETTFVRSTCQEPPDQDVGTEFLCTAVDVDDRAWEFDIVITGANEYEVNLRRAPDA